MPKPKSKPKAKNRSKGVVWLEPRNILDKAVLGHRKDGGVIYSYPGLVEGFMVMGMTEEEALEWVDYNTLRGIPYMPEPRPSVHYKRVPKPKKKAKKRQS